MSEAILEMLSTREYAIRGLSSAAAFSMKSTWGIDEEFDDPIDSWW